ncbi:MAG: PAS domain S-box protein [Gammaproteobacteria bacterium]
MPKPHRPDAHDESSRRTDDRVQGKLNDEIGSALSSVVSSDSNISDFNIEHAPLLIFRVKPNGKTLSTNKAACHTSGYSLEEILERGRLKLSFPREKHAQIAQMMDDIAQQRDLVNYELTIPNKAGKDPAIR